ncbi:M57 family metalloprotease [Noviherbaspirillum galbum]|uniref:DUF4214 domain-containing protein n=1 Tax=Noviherbaspirillum galbum TaxID=2709383 RepID=A0A6B3SGX8_9BURK|nr:M57 family metalloprotease [Noviherbaspirillum galbum]NEX60114.1 DUF4214 domain-containing protein [Noviherbaspirillum galbum]
MLVKGTTLTDTLYDTAEDDLIQGFEGNDNLYSLYGTDTIYGGSGDDVITIYYQAKGGKAYGEDGDDKLSAYSGSKIVLDGGAGNDTLYVGDKVTDATLLGGDGNDTLNATVATGNILDGGAGNDKLYSYNTATQSTMYGGDGDDYLSATSGTGNKLYGGAGNDTLYVSTGSGNLLDGGAGNDDLHIYGTATQSTLLGGEGDDVLTATSGSGNILDGGPGNDKLYGGPNGDTLLGGPGDDIFYGGTNGSIMDGGTGSNKLYGGTGDDTYLIHSLYDYIYDQGGNNKGTVYVDFYKTSPQVQNWTWAPGVQKLPYWIDSITDAGAPRIPTILGSSKTYYFAFPTTAPSYKTGADATTFVAFTETEKALARTALTYISTVLDLKFVETTTTDALNTILFSNSTQTISNGHASYPSEGFDGDDVALATTTANLTSPIDGTYTALTMIHELGHALGLKHTFLHNTATGGDEPGPALPSAEDSSKWSVMSYISFKENYHLKYSPFDIAALQYIYGPSHQDTSDSIYQLSTTTTNMIWDGGGHDKIDGTALTQPLTLYLTPGYWGYIGAKSDLMSSPGQVTVNFGTLIEDAAGGAGNDTITGNAADNTLSGNGGNDLLIGGAGNDLLDGGTGINMAGFSGLAADYVITKTANGFNVKDAKGTDGTDTLANIQRLQFSDKNIALDTADNAGKVYRLYQAAFNRKPDVAGLGWQLKAMDMGTPLSQLAQNFMSSTEFKTLYGDNPTTSKFVTLLYNNVLHRAPQQFETDFWTNIVDKGAPVKQSPATVMVSFSESPENQAQIVGSIQNGIEYQYYA